MLKATLIACLFFLALGGWLLHLRTHPLVQAEENMIPFLAGIASVLILPFLFWFKRTINFAYILNGFLVIIGTITMAHFSYVHFKGPVTLAGILMNTTCADIMLSWGKFIAGKALFDLEPLRAETDLTIRGRFFRYPNMGWWWVHLIVLTAVYALGHIIWR